MSKMKEELNRIRDLPDSELDGAVDRARDELFRARLASNTNQVQDTASLRRKRRELARILTVQQARSLGKDAQGKRKEG